MKTLLQPFALALLLVGTSALTLPAADFLVELQNSSLAPNEPVAVQLVVLNDGPTGRTAAFPATFEGVLRQGGLTRPLTFRGEPGATGETTVAPGGFARRRYEAAATGLNGRWQLELQVAGLQTFALEAGTGTATAADESTSGNRPPVTVLSGVDEQTTETSFFKRHFFPYEPFYFLAGPDSPNAKFQISFKYRVVNTAPDDQGVPEGWIYRNAEWSKGLHLAYTQRSLWDLSAESAPFLDSSYMPEVLYELRNLVDPQSGWLDRIGAQIGFQHESNGRGGPDSRSLNIAYLRMPFVFGDENDFHITLEPRAWFYVGSLSDNPDLNNYRGYLDLRAKLNLGTHGWLRELQIAGLLRAGQDFENGSAQIDVTYPLHRFGTRSFSIYLQGQYFNGYGESLLLYNQRSETWRIGIGLYR